MPFLLISSIYLFSLFLAVEQKASLKAEPKVITKVALLETLFGFFLRFAPFLLFSWLFAIEYPVDDLTVCLVNLTLVEVNIYVSHCVIAMSKRMGDSVTWNVERSCYCGPRVASPIWGNNDSITFVPPRPTRFIGPIFFKALFIFLR